MFGLLFFLYSKDYTNFYNGDGFDQQEGTGINVLYSNILYKNHNYTGILDWINKYDADVVLMVEFADEHYQNMKENLYDKYPYSARTSWSQKYFGNVVFSKYPIDNLTDNVDQGTWRYSHFNLKQDDKNYYFYLVHTSSPAAYKFFTMRNKQFNILMNDFEKHDLEQSQNNHVMVLGDFNVSPWSIYYKKLEAVMSGFKNMTKNFRILFTWRIKSLPFIISHIDHIFIDDDSVVSNITKLNTPGSDHRGFFIENFR
ncbi:MAG TPA: endonuclease/exonuclease/phosphatase family protein [Candidatus Absconditabacterales bacterium]|nr:endonuclease/exonuclease/phosphatase family protein [Candidatus Absconditabacterales bacterium]HOQ79110.1 endonuclease/exonuclease/phosphatase family protein [Candidatus Absconditabacterales bacterium]HPK28043.1 endonuclease/exonuclease/phosphatase family protein [Candidatus Absconditabacterales bacterium]